MLEKEREEKRMLQELLDDRDLKIAQLENQVAMLNKVQKYIEIYTILIKVNKIVLRYLVLDIPYNS